MEKHRRSIHLLSAVLACTMLFAAAASGCGGKSEGGSSSPAASVSSDSDSSSSADSASPAASTEASHNDSSKIKPVHAFSDTSVGIRSDGTVVIAGNTGDNTILGMFDLDEVRAWDHLIDIEETYKEKYDCKLQVMVGFLDGINDSLKTPNPIEDMTEDTEVSLDFDKEKLYYNMVGAKADWLYNLPAWNDLITEERRKELYKEQKNSGTVRTGKKIFPNDPCPCGSGKKYKHCCGRK